MTRNHVGFARAGSNPAAHVFSYFGVTSNIHACIGSSYEILNFEQKISQGNTVGKTDLSNFCQIIISNCYLNY
ncbi:hypothetical protein LINGRAHAP2_LOCUS22150, partial [Linum grandiflorum]